MFNTFLQFAIFVYQHKVGFLTFDLVKVKVKGFYLAQTNMFIAINNTYEKHEAHEQNMKNMVNIY